MDANEFGNFIMELRDKRLSRPEMANVSGYHVNTIKGYEKEGRLPDIDYLAILSKETGHSFLDLIAKRLSAGKFPDAVTEFNAAEVHVTRTPNVTPHARMQMKDGVWSVPLAWLGGTSDSFSVIEQTGTEMAPLILPGSLLAVDASDSNVLKGGIFVLNLMGQQVTRAIESVNGAVTLSGGAESIPFTVAHSDLDKLKVVGRVVAVMTKLGGISRI